MSKDYGNWCPEIYRSVYIDRHNDTHVSIAPCCQADKQLVPVDLFDFKTNSYLTQLRAQIDQGQRPTACNNCWTAEKHGHKSRRYSAIEFFNQDPNNHVALESIDHNATWACNLACVMCDPQLSSSWATEPKLSRDELSVIGRRYQKENDILDKMDFSQIKKLHFNGGEPLLNNDQTTLLTKLDKLGVLKNTVISYNTNGTIWPSDKIIDLWKGAKLVKLFFSIDATDKGFNYVRYPADWQTVHKNINYFYREAPDNVMFGANVTVGTYNIIEITDVWHWFNDTIQTNRLGDPSDFCWQFAEKFDIKNLNQNAKQHALEHLSNFAVYDGVFNYLKSTLDLDASDEWTKELDKIDQRRQTNWRQTLKIGKYY